MSASALLTSWFVSRSSRSATGLACCSLSVPGLGRLVAADQLHDFRHDRNETVVLLPELLKQLGLVLGDELQPVNVVSKLIELAERTVQRAIVRGEEGRGYAVELTGGVVLDLAVGLDLALQLDQLLGAIVDLAQALQADRCRP